MSNHDDGQAQPREELAIETAATSSAAGEGVAVPSLVEQPTPPAITEAEHQARTGGVKKAALRSGVWILTGFGTKAVLRMVSSMILTRLLFPEVFGLMNLVNAFITGLHMFSDVGISTAIIQSKRGEEPDFQNTAWTMQIIRGLGLFLCTVIIAWPVAAFYDQPLLLWLMPAVGANELLTCFNSTSLFVLGRRLARGRLVALEVGTYIIGQTVIIGLVWCYVNQGRLAALQEITLAFSPLTTAGWLGAQQTLCGTAAVWRWLENAVWFLVVGSLVSSAFQLTCSHLLVAGLRNRLCWDRTAVKDLLNFGKWIFLSTAFTFLAFYSDRLIVGAIPKGEYFLGIYGLALNLVGIATGVMSSLAGQLVFPVYSRLHHAGRDIRTAFRHVHSLSAAFAALLVTGLLSTGPTAVRCLYDDRYIEAAWVIQYLAVGAWFSMLEGTVGASLLAQGQARPVMISTASRFFGMLVFLPLGYWLRGFEGMIVGFVVSDLVRYMVVVLIARAHGMSAWIYDIALTALILAFAPAASWAGGQLALLILGHVPTNRYQLLIQFTGEGTIAVFLWGLVGLLWWLSGNRKISSMTRPPESQGQDHPIAYACSK
jgi:O-antigen/teichoic acid export membrane protein